MKKVLKFLLFLIIAVVAVVLIAGLFMKKEFHFERSITINAPQQKVWENTNSLRAMEKWSPWNDKDPNMQKTFTGTDGAVGSSYAWKGNKDVGEGNQTITKLDAPQKIDMDLNFIKPFESHALAYVVLTPDGAATKATWGFDTKFPYPMNALSKFMGMESTMDEEFTKGLKGLKALSERQ